MSKETENKRRSFLRSMVDFPTWMGLSELKNYSLTIKDLFNSLFVLPKIQGEHHLNESFDEAMQRLNLNETQLIQRAKEIAILFKLLLTAAVLILCYSIYLLTNGMYMASMLAFSVMLYVAAQAFRQHFWLYQIRRRKLGCSLQEWFDDNFRGKSK